MELIFVWVLIAFGFTSILVWGSIFEKPRNFIKSKSTFFGVLIGCTLCTSTWVGFFMSLTLGGLTSSIFDVNWFFGVFYDGMFTAGVVWCLNTIIEFFEESRIK
jgi:hypothetical protein